MSAVSMQPTTPARGGRISGAGLLSGGELGEVVQRRWVCQRVATGRLLRRLAHQDPLDRDLEDLAAERPRDLGDLEDLVRDVTGRALLADAALDFGRELVAQLGAFAQDDEERHPSLGAGLGDVDDSESRTSGTSATAR